MGRNSTFSHFILFLDMGQHRCLPRRRPGQAHSLGNARQSHHLQALLGRPGLCDTVRGHGEHTVRLVPLPASCHPSPCCPVSLLSPDCSVEESSPAPVKSKYETMDFDSLLQEAQLSLHR